MAQIGLPPGRDRLMFGMNLLLFVPILGLSYLFAVEREQPFINGARKRADLLPSVNPTGAPVSGTMPTNFLKCPALKYANINLARFLQVRCASARHSYRKGVIYMHPEGQEAQGQAQVKAETDSAAARSVLLLALLTWLLLAVTYSGAVNPDSGIRGMDFSVFYQAAARLNHGEPLYQPGVPHVLPYVYSPLPAELMRPLGRLPFETALKAWFFANAGCLILAVLLYGAAARLTWRNASLLGILLLVSFRFWDNTLNFGIGQSNDMLLGLIGGMLWADSRGRWGLLGGLIVAAALFKVWMIGLLLYLLLRRQWKPALWSAGGFAVSLGLLFSVIGWHELPAFARILRAAKVIQETMEVQNSIMGVAKTHLHANPFVTPLLNSSAVYFAFIALGVGIVLWGLTFLWRVLQAPSPVEARLAFGLTLASILLLLPTYENGYFVYCFPLLWTLLVSPDADAEAPARLLSPSRLMLGGGILIYLIFSRAWPFYTPFPPDYQHGFKSLLVSMKFFGTAALWLVGMAALHVLRRIKADAPEPERSLSAVPVRA